MEHPPLYEDGIFGGPILPNLTGELRQRFLCPPFTVLNSREGTWASRKKAWLRKGIRSELGRGDNLDPVGRGVTTADTSFYKKKTALEEELGRTLTVEEAAAELRKRGTLKVPPTLPSLQKGGTGIGYTKVGKTTGNECSANARSHYKEKKKGGGLTYGIGIGGNAENGWAGDEGGYGTSHFDPVLCELMYQWYCPPGGLIADPFSGCSVSGMVAAYLGRRFWGVDLSAAQVANNRKVVDTLPDGVPRPEWTVGDSRVVLDDAPEYDLLFSCPPYASLEVYSDNPNDISTMKWEEFRAAYAEIFYKAADALRDDRFAVITVGDVRDEKGFYRNLPAYTTAVFQKAGMRLYNECVLITAIGSLSVRTERQFVMSRKAGKDHQNVLVYVKGDPRRATDAITGTTPDERRAALDARSASRKKAVVGFDDESTQEVE